MSNEWKLLPLEPIGIGTPEIESLTSYLFRLAELHNVSPKRLVDWLSVISGSNNSISCNQPIILIRPNEQNYRFLEILENCCSLPKNTLIKMTYLQLSNPINRSPNCYSKYIRWCEACLHETLANQCQPYFRLIWGLSGVTHCPYHLIKFKDKCDTCGMYQKDWGYRDDLFTCHSCGASLANAIDINSKIDSWKFDSIDLLELTYDISTGNGDKYIKNGVKTALKQAFDEAWARDEELKFYQKLSRDECLGYLYDDRPVTLTTCRRLALRLGVNLIELLRGNLTETPLQLSPSWSSKLPPTLMPNRRKTWSNHPTIKEEIHRAQLDKSRPSLRSLAKKLKVSTGGLHYHYPEECKIISERYKQKCIDKRNENLISVEKAVNSAIHEWTLANGQLPSKKGLLRKLYPSTGLPKNLLRGQISQTIDKL